MASLLLLLLSLHVLCHVSSPTLVASSVALPGCPEKCGDVDIPYPFGFGEARCSKDGFLLTCNNSISPPKPFLPNTAIEVINVSLDGHITVYYTSITEKCHTTGENSSFQWANSSFDLTGLSPYTLSDARNKLVTTGCNTIAMYRADGETVNGGISYCTNLSHIQNETCLGVGCKKVSLPTKGVKNIVTYLTTLFNNTKSRHISNCSHAFIVKKDWYNFSITDVTNFSLKKVPVVIDWAIGNESCPVARSNMAAGFACGGSTSCLDATDGPGYRCDCLEGYQGNPYLDDGCQDIDECKDPDTYPCFGQCENIPGNYTCPCPKGTHGDNGKIRKNCIKDTKTAALVLQLILGLGFGFLFLIAALFMLYYGAKKRKMIRLKEKYFEQNGGSLLKQKTFHDGGGEGVAYSGRIFTEEELKVATSNFKEDRILGQGGNGTVYKGILPDNTIVAIKKSKTVGEQTQLQKEQFINEVIVLSQVIHRNVVKILGCCFETQVPLLVYEYVPNKTLFHHIHDDSHKTSILSWPTRLRIATETAGAIAHLHSSLATTVIHRDIKSANILLDHNFTTKVSDFGASRQIPLDQVEVATIVQGTLGYLDPEYIHTGQLTDKSDVYSFGVVLAELLTGQLPISPLRSEKDRNLTSYFLICLKEDRLGEIMEPRVARECEPDQLKKVVELVRICVRPMGEDRPNMKEVAAELEKLRGYTKHRTRDQVDEDSNEGMSSRMGSIGGDSKQSSYFHGINDLSGESNKASNVTWALELQR